MTSSFACCMHLIQGDDFVYMERGEFKYSECGIAAIAILFASHLV